jgi:hypothetical protein
MGMAGQVREGRDTTGREKQGKRRKDKGGIRNDQAPRESREVRHRMSGLVAG